MKKAFISILLFSLSISFIGCDLLPKTNSNNKSTSTATTSANGTSTSTVDTSSSTVNNSTDTLNSEDNTTTISNSINSSDTKNTEAIANRSVRLFFYDVDSGQTKYTDKTISVNNGALVSAIVNALKKSTDNQYGILDSNIDVRSAKLDKDKDLLTVNFGENFVNNMNLGAGTEASVLQAVVNSLGYNYGVNNVCITVNGKPYSSGHIVKDSNEAFKVNYENAVPMN